MDCLGQKETEDDVDRYRISRRPPEFWDTLSQIPFIPSALREFDRRFRGQSNRYSVFEKPVPRRILTRSSLRRLVVYAMDGGPDLGQLRGYANHEIRDGSMQPPPGPPGKARCTKSTANTTKTTAITTAYDAAFEQKMIDGGVYPEGYVGHGHGRQEPVNLTDILGRLEDQSAMPPDSSALTTEYKSFKAQSQRMTSEALTIATISPVLRAEEGGQHHTTGDRPFSHLEKFVDNVAVPKPDWFYGSYLQDIDKDVRKDLGRYIIPGQGPGMPAAPNFFVEAKSNDGKPSVAERQAMHAGAVGARAVFQLQNYRQDTHSYDGKAYTLSCFYLQGILSIFTTHPVWETENRRTTYHMTLVKQLSMRNSVQSYREAIATYRNARDWTKEQRDAMISEANRVARQLPAVSVPQESPDERPRTPAAGIDGGGEPARTGKRARQAESVSDVAPAKRCRGLEPGNSLVLSS